MLRLPPAEGRLTLPLSCKDQCTAAFVCNPVSNNTANRPSRPRPQVQLVRIQLRVPEYGWTTQKVFHLLNGLVAALRAGTFLLRPQLAAVPSVLARLLLLDLPGACRAAAPSLAEA